MLVSVSDEWSWPLSRKLTAKSRKREESGDHGNGGASGGGGGERGELFLNEEELVQS